MKPQSNWNRVRRWRQMTLPLFLILLLAVPMTTAHAAQSIVVGDGTPGSCTSDDWQTPAVFQQALDEIEPGGTITFNCGPDPVTIYITDVMISKDMIIDGGGLIIFTGEEPFAIGVATVVFTNFTIAGTGGEVYGGIQNYGTLTLRHLTITNNSSGDRYGGGSIHNYSQGVLTIEESVISGNHTDRDYASGGGIYNEGSLTIKNSTISNNFAYSGGGGIDNAGTLSVVNSTLSGNRTYSRGAGILNSGTARIENSSIFENTGLCDTYYDESTQQPYAKCYPGGGIYNSGTLSLINSTISGNSTGNSVDKLPPAGDGGGGIDNDGTLFLQNTTIANNTASSGGGLANTNAITLQNTILAGNRDVSQQPSDCSGVLVSHGYNLIQNSSGCTISGDATKDLLNVDPTLGPLQDNGGLTFTHALLPGSPAIDAGNPAVPGSGETACEVADQRGIARPQDGNGDGTARCDIGSLEVAPNTVTVQIDIKPGDSSNPINLKSQGVLPVAILSSSTLDARKILPSSVRFGPHAAQSLTNSLEDVNGDGRLDLVLHFRTQQAGIQAGDTQACLTGQTRTGVAIQGCDAIRVLRVSPPSGSVFPSGLVLWNKLGSESEVLNSAFGPDLGFYAPGDCQKDGCLPSVEVQGNPAYISGVFGNALTLAPGNYFSEARVYNVVLRNAGNILNAEQGAVEMWFKGVEPVGWRYGIYRLFDGAYGLGNGIGLWAQGRDPDTAGSTPRLMFLMGENCNVASDADGQPGYDLSPYTDTWIHVAAVWDRKGIAGSSKTMELFVNGTPVASTTCRDWSVISGAMDIGGGNDDQIDGKFALDNLKIWNYARTNYSDRFIEGFKK